ncbi:hypothetical protein I4U23_012258 [Adineta vaga]|nr:hypothetical protein I4U23_012258 [Adineta vaga]
MLCLKLSLQRSLISLIISIRHYSNAQSRERTEDYVTNKNFRRIDTHHHIIPDFYTEAVKDVGGDPSGWPTPKWSIEQAKQHMSLLNIETAIVSVTAPGSKIYEHDKQKGRLLARQLNEFSADLVKNNSKQFGFFASLPPLTDIEGTIDEINYAYSILKPNGFTIYTSYGQNQYLGHPSFRSIWTKFNEISTVVFIHPSEAPTSIVNRYLPQPLIDYPQETTRTVCDLVLTGIRATFPDVKIILSHAGGTLPFLAQRITMASNIPSLQCPRNARQILDDFRSFYYDTALSSSVPQLKALLAFADPSKILFGSDVPYAPLTTAMDTTKNLDAFFQKNDQLLLSINRDNARLLFPDKIND